MQEIARNVNGKVKLVNNSHVAFMIECACSLKSDRLKSIRIGRGMNMFMVRKSKASTPPNCSIALIRYLRNSIEAYVNLITFYS